MRWYSDEAICAGVHWPREAGLKHMISHYYWIALSPKVPCSPDNLRNSLKVSSRQSAS